MPTTLRAQDSVCLLQLLADLRHLYSWRRLGVVHCDHRWRTDSAANAAFVVELATQRLGLEAEDVHVEVRRAGVPCSEAGGWVGGGDDVRFGWLWGG